VANVTTTLLRAGEDGRFVYAVAGGSSGFCEVAVPGLPGGDRRWEVPVERWWDAPRIYVNGDAWVWIRAIIAVTYKLTGVHPSYDTVQARLHATPC
jgi:hypothetical protein